MKREIEEFSYQLGLDPKSENAIHAKQDAKAVCAAILILANRVAELTEVVGQSQMCDTPSDGINRNIKPLTTIFTKSWVEQ